jgi:hypothetical protein
MADAKRFLADGQRKLRDLKREAAEEEQALRANFQQKRIDTSKSGQVAGVFVNSKTRSAMARGRQMARRSIAQQQQARAVPAREVHH